jgi:hypothetical protein
VLICKGLFIGRDFCGAILLKLGYYGRRSQQDFLVRVKSLCKKQKDLWAGNDGSSSCG